jgi:hypothetical protein
MINVRVNIRKWGGCTGRSIGYWLLVTVNLHYIAVGNVAGCWSVNSQIAEY